MHFDTFWSSKRSRIPPELLKILIFQTSVPNSKFFISFSWCHSFWFSEMIYFARSVKWLFFSVFSRNQLCEKHTNWLTRHLGDDGKLYCDIITGIDHFRMIFQHCFQFSTGFLQNDASLKKIEKQIPHLVFWEPFLLAKDSSTQQIKSVESESVSNCFCSSEKFTKPKFTKIYLQKWIHKEGKTDGSHWWIGTKTQKVYSALLCSQFLFQKDSQNLHFPQKIVVFGSSADRTDPDSSISQ